MSEKRERREGRREGAVRVSATPAVIAKKGVADTSIDAISLASHRRAIAYGRARGNA